MPAKKEEEAVVEKSRGATKRHEYREGSRGRETRGRGGGRGGGGGRKGERSVHERFAVTESVARRPAATFVAATAPICLPVCPSLSLSLTTNVIPNSSRSSR